VTNPHQESAAATRPAFARLGSGLGLFAVLGGLLLAYICYPFLAFFARAGSLELASFADPKLLTAAQYSLLTAPVATVVATLFGVPLAYVLARTSFRGKVLVDSLVILPLVMPPIVGGVMLLSGFGRFTLLGTVAETLGVGLTDSYLGIVLAQTFVASPFVIITARSGFESTNPELEQAARSLGKTPLATFTRVSLPLARGHILAGVILTFTRAMGEFGATMMTAYHPHTMPTQIWITFISHGIDATIPLVLVLLVLGMGVVVGIHLVGTKPGLDL
jgi:molybdate/tungstate transport system permease protein